MFIAMGMKKLKFEDNSHWTNPELLGLIIGIIKCSAKK